MRKYNSALGIADITLQSLIIIPIVLCIFIMAAEQGAVIYLLLFQFILGLYQIFSGIVGAIKGRKWKIKYLLIALAYLVIGGAMAALLEDARWSNNGAFALFVIIGVVGPLSIGATYYAMTIIEFMKFRSQEMAEPQGHSQEFSSDILDEGII